MINYRYLYLLSVLLLAVGCAPKKPVLYPNAKFQEVGETVAQQEIARCQQLAKEAGTADGKGAEVARSTAGGAAVGGASAAAWGAVYGDAAKRGAAGAAAGAAAGLVHGTMKSREPGEVTRGFVERCLREQGYDVIGWR